MVKDGKDGNWPFLNITIELKEEFNDFVGYLNTNLITDVSRDGKAHYDCGFNSDYKCRLWVEGDGTYIRQSPWLHRKGGTITVYYRVIGEKTNKGYVPLTRRFGSYRINKSDNEPSVLNNTSNYRYVGVDKEVGGWSQHLSNTLQDFESNKDGTFSFETYADVDLSETQNSYVVTFWYKVVQFKDIALEVKHITESEEINVKDGVNRKIDSLSSFAYQNVNSDIVYNTLKNATNLGHILGVYKNENLWNPNNIKALKSLGSNYFAKSSNGYLGYAFANKMDVELRKADGTIIKAAEEIEFTQCDSTNNIYYPNLDSIINKLKDAPIEDGDKIIISMHYVKNGKIRVNYIVRGSIVDSEEKEYSLGTINITPKSTERNDDDGIVCSLRKYSVQDGIISDSTRVNKTGEKYEGNGVSVTLNADNREKTVNFIFMPPPKIEVEIEPPPAYEVIKPPTGGDSTTESTSDSNVLVLDEKFLIKWNTETMEGVDNNSIEPRDRVFIKFPFDVYYDGKFKSANNDILLKEYTVGNLPIDDSKINEEFRIPSWAVEKEYDINDTKIWIVREDREVSSKTIKITVVGRLYDFSVININGDNEWSNSMFAQQQKSNPNLQYKADTLPIGQKMVTMKEKATTGRTVSVIPQNGEIRTQNTTYPYGMKLGSSFVFSINTKGLYSEKIQITPRLKYYALNANKDGYEEKTDVKFVYKVQGKGEVDFAGSDGIIKISGAYTAPLNKYKGVSAEFSDDYNRTAILKGLAKLWNENENELNYRSLVNAYSTFAPDKYGNSYFGYDGIKLEKDLRLAYANYASSKNQLSEVQWIGKDDVLPYVDSNTYTRKAGEVGMYEQNGITDSRIINSLGHWYAEYKLPASLQVKESRQLTGIDDKANIMKGGFIVVEFEIKSLHTDSNGNDIEYLKYKDTQWNAERDNNSNEITINFPATSEKSEGATGDYEIEGDYYPVAIYDVKTTTNIAEQTAMIK